jgi:hypothetical protein
MEETTEGEKNGNEFSSIRAKEISEKLQPLHFVTRFTVVEKFLFSYLHEVAGTRFERKVHGQRCGNLGKEASCR